MEIKSIDLLAASAVLDLAAAIRKDAWDASMKDDQADSGEWRKAHPVSEFVPAALARLDGVAKQIASIRASSQR